MDYTVRFPLPIDPCRICLRETKNQAINLFADQVESKEIVRKIETCFHLSICFDKGLPNWICINCMEELNIANNFRLKCLEFDEKFAYFCEQKIKAQSCVTMNNIRNNISSEDLQSDYPEATNDNIVPKEGLECLKSIDPPPTLQGIDKLKCTVCSKVLKSKHSLTNHYLCMHQKRKHVGKVSGCGVTRRYHCTRCLYSTPHSQTLVNHMRKHDGVRPYQCECGKSFTQSSSLTAHRKTHSNTTFYTCSVCGKQFKHAFSLKKHLLVHENGNFICKICLKTLKTKQSLQDHMYRHYNIRNYSCEDCGDTFVTSSELHNHRQRHSKGNKDKVECHICGCKTNTKKSLIVHLKR